MEKKYKLTDETIEVEGKTLYRIEALKDFCEIKKGDKGGFIESENNLAHEGNAWVYDDACVYDNAFVTDDALVYDNAIVYNDARLYDNSRVYENACVYGTSCVYDTARVYGTARVTDDACVCGTARVYDNDWVYDHALGVWKRSNKKTNYGKVQSNG